jgi:PAS domain S-box-containing protein
MEITMEQDEGAWSVHPSYMQIREVLDTLNAGVVVRTLDGKILFANDRMLHWVGYTPQELDGQGLGILVPEELKEQLDHEVDEINSGDERLRITIMRRKDGRTLPVVFCPKILRNNDEILAVVSVVMDLGEMQTARRMDGRPVSGLAAGLERIAGELQTLSLFAGTAGVGEVPANHPDIALLSPREREILSELVGGQRVPAIATKLFISQHTVRNHLKSIYRKLEVPNQAALIDRIRSIGR